HVPGTINIAPTDKFNSYAGEFVDYDCPTYLIAEADTMPRLQTSLRAIGVDNLPGFFPTREMGKALDTLETLTPREAAEKLDNLFVLDVRANSEWRDGHVPGAHHIPLGQVAERLDEIPRDQTIAVQCGSGLRSQIVASLLQKHGFPRVRNLTGGFEAWEKAGLPVEKSA